jgi:ZIP family zinc transporter
MSGFTAGIMLAASMFSLLIPALDLGSVTSVAVGLLVGAGVIAIADGVLPHLHMIRGTRRGEHALDDTERTRQHTGLLVLVAMTIHNVPEGLAVGVAFAAGGPELGIPIAVAIAIQNVPEGFVSGATMVPAVTPKRAALLAAATGFVEPPAAILAYLGAGSVEGLLPAALAFAAGAMLYVVVDELVPEQQSRGNERIATFGLLMGFTLMMVLDNAL